MKHLDPGRLNHTLVIRRPTASSTNVGATESYTDVATVGAALEEPTADQVEAAGGIVADADLVALVRWDPDIRENDIAGWEQPDGSLVYYRILSARDPSGMRHAMRLFMALKK